MTPPAKTPPPRWLSAEEQKLWRLLLAATRKVSRAIDVTLQDESELSSSEFAILASLSEQKDHALRLRDLCQALEWDRSRTSHLVTRMEKRGLLSKEPCPGDARGIFISITNEGMQRLRAAAPGHVEVVRRLIFDRMDRGNVDTIVQFLQGIVDVDTVPLTPAPAPREK